MKKRKVAHRRKVAPKRKHTPRHALFLDRDAKEFYIVTRIDDHLNVANKYGGFPPMVNGNFYKGCLWPTFEGAVHAAKWAHERNPTATFGVFKLRALVEQRESPVAVRLV